MAGNGFTLISLIQCISVYRMALMYLAPSLWNFQSLDSRVTLEKVEDHFGILLIYDDGARGVSVSSLTTMYWLRAKVLIRGRKG